MGATAMRFLAALLLLTLPLPALADQCDRWTAAMEEDEGGKVMMAHVCKGTGNAAHELFLRCGASGELSIRFIPVASSGYPPNDGNFSTDFKLSFGQEVITRKAIYEDMDGAMVMDFSIGEPPTDLIQSATEMTLADTSGKVPGATFALKGSKKAVDTVIKSCTK
jgi:hypothetical protein